jgi:hypothetical protein
MNYGKLHKTNGQRLIKSNAVATFYSIAVGEWGRWGGREEGKVQKAAFG